MPYTEQHKQETRQRIITSARRLFNRNGFADVTIDQIMGEAGLTHGGFYKHFSAKEDLYNVAVLEFICAERPEPWQMKHIDPSAEGTELARMILDAYLSKDHLDDRDGSCPMIALPSDVARGNGVVKEAFRQVAEMMVGAFSANLRPADGMSERERGLALVALAVGGMVLARAVDDKAFGREVRLSARKQAEATTGWEMD
jgi:AcrR family transcriptional regulator